MTNAITKRSVVIVPCDVGSGPSTSDCALVGPYAAGVLDSSGVVRVGS